MTSNSSHEGLGDTPDPGLKPMPEEPTISTLRAMWENVDANWHDEKAHEAFLNVAVTENNLAFAAACYRAAKDGDESSRAHESEQQLQKLTALAFAQIDASHSPPPEPKRAITLVAFVVSVTLLGACIYAFAF